MNFPAALMDARNGPVSDRAPSPRRTATGRATTRESAYRAGRHRPTRFFIL
jgi:hypothetical protein